MVNVPLKRRRLDGPGHRPRLPGLSAGFGRQVRPPGSPVRPPARPPGGVTGVMPRRTCGRGRGGIGGRDGHSPGKSPRVISSPIFRRLRSRFGCQPTVPAQPRSGRSNCVIGLDLRFHRSRWDPVRETAPVRTGSRPGLAARLAARGDSGSRGDGGDGCAAGGGTGHSATDVLRYRCWHPVPLWA